MEMYLYFYLWLISYKLGNYYKGIGNTILSQRVAGGKNAKIRWNLYFCKTWECKKFFVFSCPSMMIAVFTIGSLCWSSQQYMISHNREMGTTEQCTTLFPIFSSKKGTGQKKYNRKINNIDNTLVLFYFVVPTRTTPVVLFKFKLNRFTTHSCTAYFIQTSFSL